MTRTLRSSLLPAFIAILAGCQVSVTEDAHTTIKSDVADAVGDVETSLDSTESNLAATLTDLVAAVAALDTKVTALQVDLDALEAQVGDPAQVTDVDDLATDVVGAGGALDQAVATLQADLDAAAEGVVADLEREVLYDYDVAADTVLAGSLASLEAAIVAGRDVSATIETSSGTTNYACVRAFWDVDRGFATCFSASYGDSDTQPTYANLDLASGLRYRLISSKGWQSLQEVDPAGGVVANASSNQVLATTWSAAR